MAAKKRCRWRGRAWALAAALSCLAPLPAVALDAAKRIDQYSVDHWTAADLLGAKTVFAILETRDGYLWLGSSGGLLRFDGFRFVLFEPANTPAFDSVQVRALLETPDGSLLIGLYGGGLVRLRDGHFERLGAGLPSQLVRALAAAQDGGVWVGTQGAGVFRLGEDGTLKERVGRTQGLPSDDVRALAVGRGGELWIGTEPGGLARWQGGALETFTTRSGLLGDTVMALHLDAAGDLWVATTRGLHRLRDGGRSIARFTPADGLASDYLFSLGEDRQGNLWIGTGGAGISRFASGRFASLAAAGGLPDDYVWAFHEDRAGALWIGSEGGLTRLRDGLYTLWGQRQGLPADQIHGVLEDRAGALWLAGPKGLSRLADGGVSVIGKAQGLPSDATRSLLEARDGALWASTDGDGLARIADGAITTYGEQDGLGNAMVWSLAEDREGAIWAGTQNRGLSRFAGGRWQVLSQKDGLGADNVRAVLAGRAGGIWAGKVWAGTFGGGLSLIEAGKVAATYTRRDGLGDDSILSLYEDEDGFLWIGTFSGGLTLFADGRFTSLDRRRGFFADAVGGIIGDDRGYLWIVADNGPFRVLRQDLLALFRDHGAGRAERLAFDVLGKAAGFLGSPGTGFTPNVFRRRDGRLLFPTSQGLNEIDPRRERGAGGPAAPLLESMIADHRPIELAPPPILPAGTLAVEIHYTAPSLDDPERTRFRYRLAGFDRDWVEVGERRIAYYSNLPPGEYVFRAAAAGAGGEWLESAPLPLTLLPYFYQTRFFKALLAALGAGALYLLYRLRAGQLEARAAVAEERNRLAREIHDTIAQDLAAILMHARIGQRAPDGGAGYFEDIAALATSSLTEARRSLQALRPPALDGKTLAEALRETVDAFAQGQTKGLAGGGAEITFRAAGDGQPAPAVEVELLRIAKEALHNALRHGGARRIEVELRCGRDEVALVVADDGAGFDPRAALGGFGLIGMRERAAALGGTLEVKSAPGAGARVEARAPTGGKEP